MTITGTSKCTVTSRTNACGLVLFRLCDQQTFALGTLKVKELLPLQQYRSMAGSHPAVIGMSHIRGATVPIIDMAMAVGLAPLSDEDRQNAFIILTDCMRMDVGFLVTEVNRIVETSWQNIVPPSYGLGREAYVIGSTTIDKELIQIIDIETIIANVFPQEAVPTLEEADLKDIDYIRQIGVLIVDDSLVARKQLTTFLENHSIPILTANSGSEALTILNTLYQEGKTIPLLISDIEMPGMDGYELAFNVKNDSRLLDTYIILHTSLSSNISIHQARQVGAEEAIEKFDSVELMQALRRGVQHVFQLTES